MSPLLQKKVLVLNQNYEPLSVLGIVCRTFAVCGPLIGLHSCASKAGRADSS
jgi:hypothetical protein